MDTNTKAALRPKQAAAYCGIGVSTIWYLLKRGDFATPIKLGARTTVFMRADLDAWLAKKARESGAA